MPVLRKRNEALGGYVVDDPDRGLVFELNPRGLDFLLQTLGLGEGDVIEPRYLKFLNDQEWASARPAEPQRKPAAPAPALAPAPSPTPTPKRAAAGPRSALSRRRCREIALQVLYQTEQNPGLSAAEARRFVVRRLLDQGKLVDFAETLIAGVKANQPRLDALISDVAENWRIDRMAAIDRNILRLGAFELVYCPEIPPKVAINEALELAKRYSTAQSSRFVNGILDRLQAAGHPPEPEPEPENPERVPEPEPADPGTEPEAGPAFHPEMPEGEGPILL